MALRFKDEEALYKAVPALRPKGAEASNPAPPQSDPGSPFINGFLLVVLGWFIGFVCGLLFN